MADPPSDSETELVKKQNGTIRMSLPAVLCTPDSNSDDNDTSKSGKSLLSSESKLSLPSNLGTPTSPLKLSSPLSLPASPTPFLRSSAALEKSIPPKSSQLLPPSAVSATTNITRDGKAGSGISSATGNPRNKCALQPGHSLMDWIRLGNSGKDLTGVGGRIRSVSPKELATHNTAGDAWLAIRGRVYNITHYLPYHPGGQEELMRGAGIDATQLFDKVHPWVNYDSLLSKCLVGPLHIDRPDAEELFGPSNQSPKSDRLREPSKAQELVRKSMENLANCITPVRKKITAKSEENVKGIYNPSKIMQSLIHTSDLPVSISRRAGSSKNDSEINIPSPLRFDWMQTSLKLTISVYTGSLANPGVCARLIEDYLLLEVVTDNFLRTLKLVPEQPLKEPIQLRVFAESGKIEVCVYKESAALWGGCGLPTASAATQVTVPRSLTFLVCGRSEVSHDTRLLSLDPQSAAIVIPIGHHVRVHHNVNEVEYQRSYTPVGEGWSENDSSQDSTHLKLAIKGYSSGIVSKYLTQLNTDDVITLSGPYGNFQLNKMKKITTVNLIAAGTGITPMLALIKFTLARSNPRSEKVNLLYFNKKEKDILFRNFFDKISKEDSRLLVTHVLSEASPSWSGRTGRINCSHLTDVFNDFIQCKDHCTFLTCVCGPTEFSQLACELLVKLGTNEQYIHLFMG